MQKSSVYRCLAAAGAAALLAVGAVLAADVPWTFLGDDTRAAASTGAASTPISTFVSWTYELDDDVSPSRPFSSFTPGFVLIVR